MCKFVYNYNLKCKKFIFFKDINFNFPFLFKIKNLKKFHKIYDFNAYYFFISNPVLVIYYNKSLPYFFFSKVTKLLKNYSFFYYKNIKVSSFDYNYFLYLNMDICKFNKLILNELQCFKSYIYYYILVNNYNLLEVNNYKLLFKATLKNNYFFLNVIKNQIVDLLYLIIYYNFNYFKKIYNMSLCLLLTNY